MTCEHKREMDRLVMLSVTVQAFVCPYCEIARYVKGLQKIIDARPKSNNPVAANLVRIARETLAT